MSTPVHPFLVVAFPILFLVAHNRVETVVATAGVPLGVALLAVTLILTGLGWLLRSTRKAAVVVTVLAVLFLSYGHAWNLLEGSTFGRDRVLAPVFGAAGLGAVWAVARTRRSLVDATRVLNVMALCIVAMAVVPLTLQRLTASATVAPLPDGIELRPQGPPRDIYYLVFDRYPDAETLEEHFGFDNRASLAALEERGFVIADRSRANYQNTHFSLASSLNMRHLEALVGHLESPSSDRQPFFDLISDSTVGRLLKKAGYRYVHIGSWPDFTAASQIADRNIRPTATSEFRWTLYDSTALSILSRHFTGLLLPEESTLQRDAMRGQLEALDEVADLPGPKFVFAHIVPPHPPYVFDRHGNFSPEAERRGNLDGYLEQVRFVNALLPQIVDRLKQAPDGLEPIVIIQSDEGPYPHLDTRFPARWIEEPDGDIRVKFGILNAYHLPQAADAIYATISPVNSFRVVFNRYFGTDLPLLPDESYVAVSKDDIYRYLPLGDRVQIPPSPFVPPG